MNTDQQVTLTPDSLPVQHDHEAKLTPLEILNNAVEDGASMEIVERLMTLHERWEANQGRKAFDNAIADAKEKIPPIIKNRTVDFSSNKGRTHYKFEDLAGIERTITPILSQFGLSYRFKTNDANGSVSVTCVLSHREGHSEETTLTAGHDKSGNKNSIQAIGSTITYLQRYTLKAALGLSASADDDAEKSELTAEDAQTIGDAHLQNLRRELADLGGDEAGFCEYLKVDRLEDLPAGRFGDACTALTIKRGQMSSKENLGEAA